MLDGFVRQSKRALMDTGTVVCAVVPVGEIIEQYSTIYRLSFYVKTMYLRVHIGSLSYYTPQKLKVGYHNQFHGRHSC